MKTIGETRKEVPATAPRRKRWKPRLVVSKALSFLLGGAAVMQGLFLARTELIDEISPAGPDKEDFSKADSILDHKSSYPGARAVVAYAITITDCPAGAPNVMDGPAVLGHSIHLSSIRNKNSTLNRYDYQLFAFVHLDARNCSDALTRLGYAVIEKDNVIDVDQIQNQDYKRLIEEKGCCGSKEFMKLWSFSLTDYKIVVHLDTDVVLLQNMDELFDAMLADDATHYNQLPVMFDRPLPKEIDLFYTVDYLQENTVKEARGDPTKSAVQGGFFVVKPSTSRFEQLQRIILEGNFSTQKGWYGLYYGAVKWGGAQVQGLLSFYVNEVAKESSVELNRCIYNTMVDDDPMRDGKCRTGEESCEDCRETPLQDMKTIHFTTCWKPWDCPRLKAPHPPRCNEAHNSWFRIRQSLERDVWQSPVPQDGWWFERTLGYCTKAGGAKKRYYLPLELPRVTATIG